MKTFAEGTVPGTFVLPRGELTFVGVSADPKRSKAIGYALSYWSRITRRTPSPVARSAAELAQLAYGGWTYYRKRLEVAVTLDDIRDKVRHNPKEEVAVLLLAKALALRSSHVPMQIAGVCLFRRTWYNNIFIDFLAGHPTVRLRGVGLALLWYVARVAAVLGVGTIWGETTADSVGYYNKAFRKRMSDLLLVRRAEYEAFAARMEGKE